LRLSSAYIPTQKEIPSDAVIPSHRLMLRAGLIRPLAAGIYTYLPLGWKLMQKVMTVIREEMDRIGAQEIHMPALNPIELWDETGRNAAFGDEMFRLRDRKKREMSLAPTHEEIICDLARKFVKSYRDLPQIWYQIQTKFRDEPRPRSGVVRARQFFMKDAYSLDADAKGLDRSYDLHAEAYRRIFTRCGLKFYVVGASSGLMGGSSSQEFMLESLHGEDTLVLCTQCDYAANLEVAESRSSEVSFSSEELEKVHTPGRRTIEEVSEFLGRPKTQFMKSLVYYAGSKPVMVLLRGDHELNEAKLMGFLKDTVRPAHPDEIKGICGAEAGFIGPVRPARPIETVADAALKGQEGLITGANENDFHLKGIAPDRSVPDLIYADLRNVVPDDDCIQCGGPLRVTHAMELGHIFKLGTKYSESMKALFLDPSGRSIPIIMGSYGIGVERIIAAAIEQNHDEKGMVWDKILAPYQVHLIALNMDEETVRRTAENLYDALLSREIETLFDDRNVSAGFKFKDADLMGMPVQVVIGAKGIDENRFEIRCRKTGETFQAPEESLAEKIVSVLEGIS